MYSNIPTHVLIQEGNKLEETELFKEWGKGEAQVISTELQRRYEEIKEELEEFEAFEALPA